MASPQKEYNLINLFRNYHKLGIPNYIGTTANSIFHGLLYKFNEMGFPESLKISNRELLNLSGITDIRTFRNARQKLANYLHNESDSESYLIKLTINDHKEYTIYFLNYVILQENYSNFTVELQEDYSKISEIEKDRPEISTDLCKPPAKNAPLSDTILDNTIQYSFSSQPDPACKEESPKNPKKEDDKDDEKIGKAKSIIGKVYLPIPSSFLIDDLLHIGGFSEEQIRNVVNNSKRENVHYQKLPIWIMKGLDNYNLLYGDNGNGKRTNEVKSYMDGMSDEAYQAMRDNQAQTAKRLREEREQAQKERAERSEQLLRERLGQ